MKFYAAILAVWALSVALAFAVGCAVQRSMRPPTAVQIEYVAPQNEIFFGRLTAFRNTSG